MTAPHVNADDLGLTPCAVCGRGADWHELDHFGLCQDCQSDTPDALVCRDDERASSPASPRVTPPHPAGRITR
jgi:hypothetical protein